MKTTAIAAMLAAFGMTALAQPASACSNGYESVWIQGHKVCKLKTPKLGLKANTASQPGKAKAATITPQRAR